MPCHYLNQCWPSSMTHFMPQWVNSLWFSEAQQICGSTLAQLMTCCSLMAPGHYLNQCWHISMVQWISSQDNFTRDAPPLNISYLKSHSNLAVTNELTSSKLRNHITGKWTPVAGFRNRLTHWGRDKMAAIFQTIFSNTFSWMKMYEFLLRFHWSLFLSVQLTIFHHRFR